MLDIQFAAAKVNKYASRESGDTVEIVERPAAPGGFTMVLADGQGSGRNAKTISHLVTSRCVALIKEGVRDGAVARAASDQLYAYRHGQVSATLNLITADFATHTLVITRNNPEPVYISRIGQSETLESVSLPPEATTGRARLDAFDEPSLPIGIYPRTRPVIRELALEPGLVIVAFSDGLSQAGVRYEEKLDIVAALGQLLEKPTARRDAQALADELLKQAIERDRRRPQDDMSVIVLITNSLETEDGAPLARRLSVNIALV